MSVNRELWRNAKGNEVIWRLVYPHVVQGALRVTGGALPVSRTPGLVAGVRLSRRP